MHEHEFILALNNIKQIAMDIDKTRGCLPNDRKRWVHGYTWWADAEKVVGHEFAMILLRAVDSDDRQYFLDTSKCVKIMAKVLESEHKESLKNLKPFARAMGLDEIETLAAFNELNVKGGLQ